MWLGSYALLFLFAFSFPALAQEGPVPITEEELDELLRVLRSDDAAARWEAVQEVLNLDKDSLPILHKRLHREHRASGESMKRILYSLRKDLKEAKVKDLIARGKAVNEGSIPVESPPEFLKILVERKREDNEIAWRGATEVMTILIAMALIGTRDALLSIIDFAPAHSAAFRKEIYQILVWVGESALPPLIMRKGSKDENVQIVVNASLERLGMVRPAQQVQVKNGLVLAEVLLLYGKMKDFEAIDVVLPFLNADNPLVRKAARDAILMYGRGALWALRKEYRNYKGEDADPSWPAEKVAEELFTAQDKERLAPLHEKMEEGLRFAKEGKFDRMEACFREILALQPLYDRRSEMVPGYMEAALRRLEQGNLEKASLLLRTARRLNQDASRQKKILALLFYVEALRSLEDGVADPDLLRKAVKLDPSLKQAKSKLREVEKIYREKRIRGYKILAAGGIVTASVLLLVLLFIRRL